MVLLQQNSAWYRYNDTRYQFEDDFKKKCIYIKGMSIQAYLFMLFFSFILSDHMYR